MDNKKPRGALHQQRKIWRQPIDSWYGSDISQRELYRCHKLKHNQVVYCKKQIPASHEPEIRNVARWCSSISHQRHQYLRHL